MDTKENFFAGKIASTARPPRTRVAESLRPKRRYKIQRSSPELDAVKPLPAATAAPPSRGPRLKRSGRPHQTWNDPATPLPSAPAKKSGITPAASEVLRLLTRATASVSSAYLRHSH